jgi:hypothetical protein
MLESKWGKLVSYGERLTRTFNYPQMMVYHINQNGPPLEVVFNKLTNEVVSAKYIHQHLYDDKLRAASHPPNDMGNLPSVILPKGGNDDPVVC